MDRNLAVVLNDFKFRMRDDNARAAALGTPVNDQALPGHDHLFDPMRAEPAASEGRAQGVGIFLLQQHVEHFLPATDTPEARLLHQAANADRLVAFARGKMIEARAVLVAFGEVSEQSLDRGNPDPLELALPWRRDPVQVFERGGGMHGESWRASKE